VLAFLDYLPKPSYAKKLISQSLIEDLRYLASIRFAFILVLVAQIYFY
jgi:hypothetical protein